MTAVHPVLGTATPSRATWAVVAAGLACLYLPTYWWAATTIWQTDEQAHGAIILMLVAWLFSQRRMALLAASRQPAPVAGWGLFILGLLLYIVGRSQDISIFEIGSQIPVLAGLLLLLVGPASVRAAWFPLLYIIFMIPLPGALVDAITGPLKHWISGLAETILYSAGYPIARSGVVLSIGQYQLLVADACSGLHSMYSLSALGALFMYIKGRRSLAHNAIMLSSILPVAFAANVVRVLALVLLTYHFGDEAGQGFLHGAAGIVLLVVSILFLALLDAILARFFRPAASIPAYPAGAANATVGSFPHGPEARGGKKHA